MTKEKMIFAGVGVVLIAILIAAIFFAVNSSNDEGEPGIGIPALTVNTLTVNTSVLAPTITGTDMVVNDQLSVGGTSVFTGDATFSAALSAVDITDTGSSTLADADINGGSIDGVTIGGAVAPTVTDLGTVTTADINGGTIDGATIGGAVAGAGTFTSIDGEDITDTGSSTFADAEITLADINGGSIDGVTIGGAAAPTVTDLGSVTTADINGGTIDAVTIGGASAAAGDFVDLTDTGSSSFADADITTVDIDGGTIDGTAIGGSSAAAGEFTTVDAVDITDTGSSTFAEAEIADLTVTTAMSYSQGAFDRSESFPFVSGSGSIADAPFGWDIDAESETAYSFGVIPQDCNQVTSIIIWAGAVSGGTVHAVDIDIYGATNNEPYNTGTYSANDVSSDTAVTANDITRWTVTDSGVAGAAGLTAGDVFVVKVIGAPASGAMIATDCRFMAVEVRYD